MRPGIHQRCTTKDKLSFLELIMLSTASAIIFDRAESPVIEKAPNVLPDSLQKPADILLSRQLSTATFPIRGDIP